MLASFEQILRLFDGVAHRRAQTVVKQGGTSYIFVTEEIENALQRAQDAAGLQDVLVNGGANIARQFLNAGLLDEVRNTKLPDPVFERVTSQG